MRWLQRQALPAWMPVVVAVTGVQAVLALIIRAQPLLAVPLTEAAGVSAASVGQLASATSLGSMLFFLWGTPALAHVDSARQLRAGCLLAAAAILLCVWPSWSLMLIAALLIGIGYAPSAPAGSDVLMRAVPLQRRALGFSIKQAGVPLGGLVAGLVLPFVLLRGGLEAALYTVAGIAVVTALLLRHRFAPDSGPAKLDRGKASRARFELLAPLAMFRMLFAGPGMRSFAIAGFGLAFAQGVLLGYYPVYLIDRLGLSIAAAGAQFALLQAVGVGGRILMGWASDAIGSPKRALMMLGLSSAATMFAIAGLQPGGSLIVLGLVSALAGLTIVSWNGVFLAAVASAAPEGKVSHVTAAATVVVFVGYVISPLTMQGVVHWSASYPAGFLLAGIVPALATVAPFLLRSSRGE